MENKCFGECGDCPFVIQDEDTGYNTCGLGGTMDNSYQEFIIATMTKSIMETTLAKYRNSIPRKAVIEMVNQIIQEQNRYIERKGNHGKVN